jgi:hypothetical protein
VNDGWRALIDVFFLGLGLLLLSAGGIGLYALWHHRGRDPHTGFLADVLPQPPDDLPPGAAGTLLDEHADHCDVVATLADLGRRGVLAIDDLVPTKRGKRHDAHGYALTLVDPAVPVAPFEAELLHAFYGRKLEAGESVRLGEVKRGFTNAQPAVKEKLYAELVRRGYFLHSPAATRRRWRDLGFGLLALSVLLATIEIIGFGGYAWFPAIVGVILASVTIPLSRKMPRKTGAGAEASAKWRAFRRHLSQVERYSALPESRDAFDRFLPYAVAFELDRTWIKAFAKAGVPAPRWYHMGLDAGSPFSRGPSARPRGDWAPDVGGDIPVPTRGLDLGGPLNVPIPPVGDLPNVDLPSMPDLPNVDLDAASDLLGGSLQGVSDGLLGLFEAAGSIFESIDFDIDL